MAVDAHLSREKRQQNINPGTNSQGKTVTGHRKTMTMTISMNDRPTFDRVGNKRWYKNGQLHRIDGPAVKRIDGTEEWYQNGKFHRLDGPAVELFNGDTYWYIADIEYTEGEFNNHPLVLLNRFVNIR